MIFLWEFMPIRNWHVSLRKTLSFLNHLMATTRLFSVFTILKFGDKFTFIFEVPTTLITSHCLQNFKFVGSKFKKNFQEDLCGFPV